VKVLVTGGCGFIGAHTCEFFRRGGWEVIAYDNLTKFELKRTGYRADAARDYNWNLLGDLGVQRVEGDIRNVADLLDHASGCDFIVHTAAQPAVTISIEEPITDLQTNVLGTANVLEAARKHSIPIVSCATIHVYGNWINDTVEERDTRYIREPASLDENTPTMKGCLTPLHASKASAEYYVRAYVDTYGVRAASYRLTGLYGPGQFGGEDHGWVANFSIRNILRRPLTIYGSGKQVRDILFATDLVRAFYDFFIKGEPGIYNIGGGPTHAISLLECIRLIEKTTGIPADVSFEPARFGDLNYFVCDTTRARQQLGWQPKVTPQEGIPILVEWIQKNRELFAA
jgi:CDP-paratose 2-epimerase